MPLLFSFSLPLIHISDDVGAENPESRTTFASSSLSRVLFLCYAAKPFQALLICILLVMACRQTLQLVLPFFVCVSACPCVFVLLFVVIIFDLANWYLWLTVPLCPPHSPLSLYLTLLVEWFILAAAACRLSYSVVSIRSFSPPASHCLHWIKQVSPHCQIDETTSFTAAWCLHPLQKANLKVALFLYWTG